MMNDNKIHYMSQKTGEIVFTKKEAMELYRAGHEISVWFWSDVCQEMVERIRWEH